MIPAQKYKIFAHRQTKKIRSDGKLQMIMTAVSVQSEYVSKLHLIFKTKSQPCVKKKMLACSTMLRIPVTVP